MIFNRFPTFTFVLALFAFITLVAALSGPRTVSHNEKHLTVQTLEVATVYGQNGAPTWNPSVYVIAFPWRFQYSSNMKVFFSLGNFSFVYPDKYINFYGKMSSKNQTGLVFNVYSNMTKHIQKLTYRYLLISGDYASIQSANTNLLIFESNFTWLSSTVYYPYSVNTTGGYTFFYSPLGFDLSSGGSLSFCYHFYYTCTSTSLNVAWYGHASSPDLKGYIYLSVLIFNTQFFNRANFGQTTFWQTSTCISGYGGGTSTLSTSFDITQKNTLINYWNLYVNTPTSMFTYELKFPTNQSFTFSYSSSRYCQYIYGLTMFTYACDYKMPYYDPILNTCYDVCPNGTTTDSINLHCCPLKCRHCNLQGECIIYIVTSSNFVNNYTCPYDCQNCNYNADCITCRPNQFRTLYRGRCIASNGYYENDLKQIISCPSNCSLCSSISNCSACSSGYYLSGLTCVTVCPNGKYPNTSSRICESCPTGCTLCSSLSNCSACSSIFPGFFLNDTACLTSCPSGKYEVSINRTCQYCLQNCEQCSSSSTCQLCALGSYLYKDLVCYQRCPSRTYSDSSVRQCLPCPFDCLTCRSNNICLSCDSTNDLRRLENGRCVPAAGFYEDSYNLIFPCPVQCSHCSSPQSCSACSGSLRTLKNGMCVALEGYYESNFNEIVPCSSQCTLCQSEAKCSACAEGYELNVDKCERTIPMMRSQFFKLSVGVVIFVVIMIQTVTIIVLCCRKISGKIQTLPMRDEIIEETKSAQILFKPEQEEKKKEEKKNFIKQWKQLDLDFLMPTDCIGCMLAAKPEVATSCSHHFHLSCFGKKVFLKAVCPTCEASLTNAEMLVSCRNCELKGGVITFESFIELSQENKLCRELICLECQENL